MRASWAGGIDDSDSGLNTSISDLLEVGRAVLDASSVLVVGPTSWALKGGLSLGDALVRVLTGDL